MEYETETIRIRWWSNEQARLEVDRAIERYISDGWELAYEDQDDVIGTREDHIPIGKSVITLVFRRPVEYETREQQIKCVSHEQARRAMDLYIQSYVRTGWEFVYADQDDVIEASEDHVPTRKLVITLFFRRRI